MELTNKKAVVTGAASGIGAAVAAQLADEGVYVLVADRSIEQGTEVAGALGEHGRFAHLDVTSDGSWQELITTTRDWLGSLDILVNCAGVAHHRNVVEETVDDYRRLVEINQFGTFRAIKAAEQLMPDGGSVVTIASINTLLGMRDSVSYAASKAAVLAMTRCAAHDLAPRNIRLNAVSPGIVATAMAKERGATDLAAAVDTILEVPGRMATADEIASVVTFLASPRSGYVNGADILVDGGVTLLGAGHRNIQ